MFFLYFFNKNLNIDRNINQTNFFIFCILPQEKHNSSLFLIRLHFGGMKFVIRELK